MIGGRMCLPIRAPADKCEAANSRGALNIYRLQDEPRAAVLVACTRSLSRRHHQVRKLRQEMGKKKG
jgi:hypothetical protein